MTNIESSEKAVTGKESLAQQLARCLDSSQIAVDNESLNIWGTDWTRSFSINPSAIVFPKTTEQIVELVKLAPELGISLVPSGGRTGLSGGAVASDNEVVVSMDRMNQILDFNPVDRIVRCQAGLITARLQEFATEQNLFYPVDFASSGSSQIGGNIATNAGGIRVIRYGMTRESIAGLKVVTGTGDVLDLNKGLMKNATGYDLRHFFIGSEGTLGIVTEAEIRLIPQPENQIVQVLGVNDLRNILQVLQLFQSKITLSAFEFFSDLAMQKVLEHRDALQRPFSEVCPYYVLLEYDESEDDSATEAFTEAYEQNLVLDGIVSQSLQQAASLWELREGISESIAPYTPYKNDVSVPVKDIPDFLTEVDQLVQTHYPDFEVCWYGHIGDGNLHLNILRPSDNTIEEFYERCHSISPMLFEKIQQRRGSISAEHGVGLLKRDFLGYSRSDAEMRLMQQLKSVFDPNGIMNPGKLLTSSTV